jgi:hypothetical protein
MRTRVGATARLSRAPHLVLPHGHHVDPREQIIRRQWLVGRKGRVAVVYTENLIRVDDVVESPKLAE